MNYAFLDINPKNNKVDQFIIAAPRHQFFVAINWNFMPHWSTNLRSISVIDRKRSSLDNRSKLKDYTKVDFTLVSKGLLNVFDSNIREPSVDYKSIPGDYPFDDRTFLGMISINF